MYVPISRPAIIASFNLSCKNPARMKKSGRVGITGGMALTHPCGYWASIIPEHVKCEQPIVNLAKNLGEACSCKVQRWQSGYGVCIKLQRRWFESYRSNSKARTLWKRNWRKYSSPSFILRAPCPSIHILMGKVAETLYIPVNWKKFKTMLLKLVFGLKCTFQK